MRTKSADGRVRTIPLFDGVRCKKCGLCAAVCPIASIECSSSELPRLQRPEECTACRKCEYICPDFAVKMVER